MAKKLKGPLPRYGIIVISKAGGLDMICGGPRSEQLNSEAWETPRLRVICYHKAMQIFV